MQTPLLSQIDTVNTLILFIILYLIQLTITEALITTLNKLDPNYKRTPIHYFVPFVSVIAYGLIVIEELYAIYIKPILRRIYNYITNL